MTDTQFIPNEHLINIARAGEPPRMYLPVAARLLWFRQDHPEWTIATRPIEINVESEYAIFQATVSDSGVIIGMGTKAETVVNFSDYIEKAETGAIGRALAVCGYGTQFAPELNEGSRIADAPAQPRPPSVAPGANLAPSNHAPAAAPRPQTDAASPYCQVAGCGAKLTARVFDFSMSRYGIPLCYECQQSGAGDEVSEPPFVEPTAAPETAQEPTDKPSDFDPFAEDADDNSAVGKRDLPDHARRATP